jgi:polysaccharide pyruvyl transferase WcaK-like protein
MTRCGVGAPGDDVVPDLVFGWPVERMPSPRVADTPPQTVGVGLMAYTGWNLGDSRGRLLYTTYLGQMASFVRWLVRSGYRVRFLIGERHTDAAAVRDLLEHLEPDFLATYAGRLAVPGIDTVADLLREIALTDLVVATRFHNLVFALALSRPVISIGYAAKFEALMHEMGLDNYCQRVETLDVERLKRQLSQLAASYGVTARIVAARTAAYRERVERLFDETFGPVGDEC